MGLSKISIHECGDHLGLSAAKNLNHLKMSEMQAWTLRKMLLVITESQEEGWKDTLEIH